MKELDNETGLYYYGMRYYAAWICRFISVDPLQHKYPIYTPFQYAGNKPISFIDLDGAEPSFSEILKSINTVADKQGYVWHNDLEAWGYVSEPIVVSAEQKKDLINFDRTTVGGLNSCLDCHHEDGAYFDTFKAERQIFNASMVAIPLLVVAPEVVVPVASKVLTSAPAKLFYAGYASGVVSEIAGQAGGNALVYINSGNPDDISFDISDINDSGLEKGVSTLLPYYSIVVEKVADYSRANSDLNYKPYKNTLEIKEYTISNSIGVDSAKSDFDFYFDLFAGQIDLISVVSKGNSTVAESFTRQGVKKVVNKSGKKYLKSFKEDLKYGKSDEERRIENGLYEEKIHRPDKLRPGFN